MLRSADMLKDRVLMVDNTPNVMIDSRESKLLVVCPSYEYTYAYDVLGHLSAADLHKNYRRIEALLHISSSGFNDFLAAYYSSLANDAIAAASNANVRALRKDMFWNVFQRVLRKVVVEGSLSNPGVAWRPVTPGRVEAMNRHIARYLKV